MFKKFNLNKAILYSLYLMLPAAVGLFGYGVYFYFLRNDFQKLATSGDAVNFFVIGKDKAGNGDVAFLSRINPLTNQVGFFFLHPETRIEADGPTFSAMVATGDESDMLDQIEEVIREPIQYKITVGENSLGRALDLLEGLRVFIQEDAKDYKGNVHFAGGQFFNLSGDSFARYAKLLKSNDNIGRLARMHKHASIVLEFFNRKDEIYRPFLRSDLLVKLLLGMVEISPNLSTNEALSLRDFIAGNKIVTGVTRFALEPKTVDGGERLVLRKKRSAVIASQFLKKLDKEGGIYESHVGKTKVLNAAKTNADGLARNVSYRLKSKGIFHLKPENYPMGYLPETVILDYSGHPEYAKKLAKELKLKPGVIAEMVDPSKGVDLDAIVILGEDFPRKKQKKKQ